MKNVSQHGAATDANRPLTDYGHIGFGVGFISRCLLSLLPLTALTGCAPHSALLPPSTILVSQQANVASHSREAEKALYNAAGRGDINIVKRLLASGVNADFVVPMGGSPVDEAADFGHMEVVKLLLAYLPNLAPQTARHYIQSVKNNELEEAIKAGSLRRVKVLIASGADANEDLPYEVDASAFQKSSVSVPILKCLLAHSNNVNAHNFLGRTLLMRAALSGGKVMALLLTHGAIVNPHDQFGETALMDAAQDGDVASVRLLIAHGAAVNLQNKEGQTALMLASYRFQVNAENARGLAFTLAQARIRRAKVRLLRQGGADPRLKDKKGKMAADYWHMDFYDGPAS